MKNIINFTIPADSVALSDFDDEPTCGIFILYEGSKTYKLQKLNNGYVWTSLHGLMEIHDGLYYKSFKDAVGRVLTKLDTVVKVFNSFQEFIDSYIN